MINISDQDRIDWLEEQNQGRCIYRRSLRNRGWRLHETSRKDASKSVREAIDKAIIRDKVMKTLDEVFGDPDAK